MTLNFPEAAKDLLESLEPDNVEGYTVAYGNAFSGMQCIGYYTSFEEAIHVAEARSPHDDWHIVPIWKE